MADFFAAFGTIINSMDFLGGGIQIILFGLVFALSRAVTKDEDAQEMMVWVISLIFAVLFDWPIMLLLLNMFIWIPLAIKIAVGWGRQ